jgi:hypothetical protein
VILLFEYCRFWGLQWLTQWNIQYSLSQPWLLATKGY